MFCCLVHSYSIPFSVSAFFNRSFLLKSLNWWFYLIIFQYGVIPCWNLDTMQWLIFLLKTGAGTTSSSAQGTSDTGVANDNLSHHQARVRAAVAAASVYEKSYVYPCASTLVWYAFLLQTSHTRTHQKEKSMTNFFNYFYLFTGLLDMQ